MYTQHTNHCISSDFHASKLISTLHLMVVWLRHTRVSQSAYAPLAPSSAATLASSPGPHLPPATREPHRLAGVAGRSHLSPLASHPHPFLSLQRPPRFPLSASPHPDTTSLSIDLARGPPVHAAPRGDPHLRRGWKRQWCSLQRPEQPQLRRESLCADNRRRNSRAEPPRRLPGNRTLRRRAAAASGEGSPGARRRRPRPGFITQVDNPGRA